MTSATSFYCSFKCNGSPNDPTNHTGMLSIQTSFPKGNIRCLPSPSIIGNLEMEIVYGRTKVAQSNSLLATVKQSFLTLSDSRAWWDLQPSLPGYEIGPSLLSGSQNGRRHYLARAAYRIVQTELNHVFSIDYLNIRTENIKRWHYKSLFASRHCLSEMTYIFKESSVCFGNTLT